VLPWLSGDWTTLREDADGYARLAGPDGVRVIAQNLAYGLDSLSAGWDSPAARQFCYTVREHWLPAIEALGHVLQLHARVFEWMAQQSENALKAIVLTVEAIRLWLVERALRLATLAGSVAGLGTVWRELADLGTDVLAAWHQLETILDMTRMALRSGVDLLGALGAEATLIEDLAAGRLAPLSAG